MKKVALTLRGGMFKCYVYLGVIKSLTDNEIPIDAILATSGGGLIGGLYASGLTIEEILNYSKEFQFRNFIGLDSIRNFCFISSNKIIKTLKKQLPVETMEECPTKLYISVTDLKETQPAYLQTGDLATAIAAGCSYPTMVSPVKFNNKYYADGAFSSAYSAKFLREEGYDVVIGATVGGHNNKVPAGMSLMERVPEHIRILTQQLEKLEQRYEPVDVLIDGLAVGYSRSDIKSATVLFNRGFEITEKYIPQIKKFLQ